MPSKSAPATRQRSPAAANMDSFLVKPAPKSKAPPSSVIRTHNKVNSGTGTKNTSTLSSSPKPVPPLDQVLDLGNSSDSDIEILGDDQPAVALTKPQPASKMETAVRSRSRPLSVKASAPTAKRPRLESTPRVRSAPQSMSRESSKQSHTGTEMDVMVLDDDDDHLDDETSKAPRYADSSRSSASPAVAQPLFRRGTPDLDDDGENWAEESEAVPEGVASEDDGELQVPTVGMDEHRRVFAVVEGSSRDLEPRQVKEKGNTGKKTNGKTKGKSRATEAEEEAKCPVCSIALSTLPKSVSASILANGIPCSPRPIFRIAETRTPRQRLPRRWRHASCRFIEFLRAHLGLVPVSDCPQDGSYSATATSVQVQVQAAATYSKGESLQIDVGSSRHRERQRQRERESVSCARCSSTGRGCQTPSLVPSIPVSALTPLRFALHAQCLHGTHDGQH